ncbi:hypothetical protein [Microbacterium murale]|uniref:SnoaL-like domain-containing protein n=1 Tax=Microbacterium murale TaxID=1081040 RepID=A0ABQ1RRI5_9MICO|nr:hypothetical protein [Microbacterium murale]GGD78873.1 hypothetical protein GCM10007269_22160 [Microbacterium murale]
MSIETSQITDYLDRYAATLSQFNAEGAAELWSTPGMIADDRFSGVLESRDKMVDGLKQSYPLYQRLGLASVGYELVEENHLSEALVLARVHWLFLDANGDELTDSNSYCLLRNEESGLRACVCVESDSAEKLQALATARAIDLMLPTRKRAPICA